MTDIKTMLTSPEYQNLPETERAKVVEHYLPKMPEFQGLPDEEKAKVLNLAVTNKLSLPKTTAEAVPAKQPEHPHTLTPVNMQHPTLSQWDAMPEAVRNTLPPKQAKALHIEDLSRKIQQFKDGNSVEDWNGKRAQQESDKAVKELWTQFTKSKDPKELKLGEVAKESAGGAISGTAMAVATPKLMGILGQALVRGPGVSKIAGASLIAAGKALDMIPVKERMILGAGGGAGMGATETVADSMGASPAVKTGIGIAGSGLGEATSSFLQKQMRSLLRVAGFATYGSGHGIALAASELLRPNERLNMEVAKNLQNHLFGKQIEGKIAGVRSEVHRAAAQLELRKANPDIPYGIPASTYYREKYFDDLTELITPKDLKVSKASLGTFSRSQQFKDFSETLATKLRLGQITRNDAGSLMTSLTADRSRSKPVLTKYAENLDNQIRFWAKSAEKDGIAGANAASQKVDMEVRSDLQKAVNGFLKSKGKGATEDLYRSAAKKEYTAEAKDTIPYLVSHYGKEGDMSQLVRNLNKDPETHQLFIEGVKEHLQSVPPEKVADEFKRLDTMLVRSKIFDIDKPEQAQMLQHLRNEADKITKTAKDGEQTAVGDRFKRVIVNLLARQLGVSAGEKLTPDASGGGQ